MVLTHKSRSRERRVTLVKLLWVLLVWLVVSVPVALLVGKVIRAGMEETESTGRTPTAAEIDAAVARAFTTTIPPPPGPPGAPGATGATGAPVRCRGLLALLGLIARYRDLQALKSSTRPTR